ncbi:biopolymer transporter ExbD [Luteolibacter ambystomatis]|uniref:Biopolymer transporter ExbD n=1 Tax=Luteolibacter ambystomatis TaxID=2824561 RepID=A0A975J136_9BACT|nr:biopolymer transporter ExbD [Luteolibacter ambystomatis]QUE52096.1 biopolymer transporter ExbD [Luteolibacter ambystomatis]
MKKRKHKASSDSNLGFQIAPMIDVVFVIMLYFMVMAGAVQKENSHNTKLPGTEVSTEGEDIPDEVSINIEEDGQVSLNDEPVDSPGEAPLPDLLGNLNQLKLSSDAAKAKILVTIYAADQAPYQRIIDVLDVLGQLKIENVTFQAGAAE